MANIVINCGTSGPDRYWDGRDLATGLGGSESQAVGWAEALAKRGHRVVVLCHCEYAFNHNGVAYFPWADSEYMGFPKATDIHIAWRHYDLLAERRAPIQILACHDIPVHPHCPDDWDAWPNIDAVWLLNNYHADLWSTVPEAKKYVCPVGLNTVPYDGKTPKRVLGKCVYISHPDRGLHDLRRIWPEIKAAAPHATLHAFWWQPEFFLPEDSALGIMPMRSLGEEEMADELLTSDIFSYPCSFQPEISPVSCLKAQLAGALPVYIPVGGVAEVTKFGFKVSNLNDFKDLLIRTLNTDLWQLNRQVMRDRTARIYAWEKVVDRFEAKWCSK